MTQWVMQPGFQVITAVGRVLFDAYGPDAESRCVEYARTHSLRGFGYRIEATSRRIAREALEEQAEALRVATLLGGASAIIPDGGQSMADDTAERDGYQLGSSLAKIIAPGGTADTSALINLGMFFSELKGYRDLRTGNMFVTAFAQGFKDSSPGADIGRRIGSGSVMGGDATKSD